MRRGPVLCTTAVIVVSATAASALAGGDLAPWASAVSCPVGSPVGSTSTCEVTFTTSGSFTMPSGVTQIEALIVGSGGKSLADTGYAGGGGEVKVVTLANSGNLTVTIGTSGVTSPANNSIVAQAGGSTVTASGGGAGTNSAVGVGGGSGANKGGDGGNGNSGTGSALNGGFAIQVDALATSGSLFDGVTDWYGGGGAGGRYSISVSGIGGMPSTTMWSGFNSGTPGPRAGWVTDTPPDNGSYPVDVFNYPTDKIPTDKAKTLPVPVMNSAAANSGGGAGATNWGGDSAGTPIGATVGANGIVVVRYVRSAPVPPPAPTDPDTLVAVAQPDPIPPPKAPAASSNVDALGPWLNATGPSASSSPLPPGGLALFVAGEPQSPAATAKAGQFPQSLVYVGEGWQLQVQGLADPKAPLPLGPGPSLALASLQGSSGSSNLWAFGDPEVSVSGTGLQPGSPVRFYLLPSTYLGQLTSDATGSYSGRISIPAELPPGQRTLQVNGFTPAGSVRSLNIGVDVRAMKPARLKVAKTRVFFDPLSAELSPVGKASLRRLVKKTGRNAMKTVALGYVQPTARIDNNDSLSMKRAKNLTRYLRELGLKGTYVTLGRGAASQRGATARRVTVKVTYRP